MFMAGLVSGDIAAQVQRVTWPEDWKAPEDLGLIAGQRGEWKNYTYQLETSNIRLHLGYDKLVWSLNFVEGSYTVGLCFSFCSGSTGRQRVVMAKNVVFKGTHEN
jgi:hypothetical protein